MGHMRAISYQVYHLAGVLYVAPIHPLVHVLSTRTWYSVDNTSVF